MRNHSTVKERRGEFDRPKPTRTAKKSSIRRPVGRGEDGMGGENVDHKGDSSYFDVSRVPISLLRLTFV